MTKKIIKKLFPLLLITFLLAACEESPDQAQAVVSISTATIPAAISTSTFQDLQGNPVEISDYLGKKLILNYWATWCAPCIREIPALNRAAETLKDEGFIFLLASDESLDDITEFLLDHEFKGNFIKLNTFFASFGVEAVPSTILYDSAGKIINTWVGEYAWDSEEILTELREAE